MNVVEKTSKRTLLEATLVEVEACGIDMIWDNIRSIYPIEKYPFFSIKIQNDLVLFEMAKEQRLLKNI